MNSCSPTRIELAASSHFLKLNPSSVRLYMTPSSSGSNSLIKMSISYGFTHIFKVYLQISTNCWWVKCILLSRSSVSTRFFRVPFTFSTVRQNLHISESLADSKRWGLNSATTLSSTYAANEFSPVVSWPRGSSSDLIPRILEIILSPISRG